MIPMRQRLLLVAGWLAAAIGSVLVASGAVTIAGGQVLDRPLRPLTAAEVAALPVVSVGSTEVTEPQASGGIVRTTREPTAGSDEIGAGSQEPTGTRGDAASSDDQTGRWDRFTKPGSSETLVASLQAGKASFAVTDDELRLLWATPGAGYVMSTVRHDTEAITILFSSDVDTWLVEAELIDGELVVDAGPGPLS